METLIEKIHEANHLFAVIKRYVRRSNADLTAHYNALDTLQKDSWIRRHRSHLRHSITMDKTFDALDFPANAPKQKDASQLRDPDLMYDSNNADDEKNMMISKMMNYPMCWMMMTTEDDSDIIDDPDYFLAEDFIILELNEL